MKAFRLSRLSSGVSLGLCILLASSGWVFSGNLNAARAETVTQQDRKAVKVHVQDAVGNVAGASVIVKGTMNGGSTDMDGNVIINNVPSNAVLVISSIGYNTVEIPVAGKASLNVFVEESAIALDEVVAIGYGSLKSSQISNSVTKVSGKDLIDRPSNNIVNALQGKMAGVVVKEVSGRPGSGLDITVRGLSSINYSNTPLYVIDGFPTTDASLVDVNDVESIEVLKDAASAAIYGSRGANGVVLITTKSGKKGKPVVTFDASLGTQTRFSKVDVLNRDEWIEYAIEERINTYEYNGGDFTVPEDQRKAPAYAIDPLWRGDISKLPDNDWQKIVENDFAPIQKYGLSISGASEKVRYFASGNYYDQVGLLQNSWHKNFSFNSKVEADATDWLTVGLNMKLAVSETQDPNSDTQTSRSILCSPVLGIDQNTEATGYHKYLLVALLNPVALLNEMDNLAKKNNSNTTGYLIGHILPGLDLKTSVNYYKNQVRRFQYLPSNINRGTASTGTLVNSETSDILSETTLTYDKTWNKLSLNALAGYTYEYSDYYTSTIAKNGYPDDTIKTLNAATNVTSSSSSEEEWALMSYLARANLSYDNKYVLSASIRRDGCSRFGKLNKWGTFPSVSAAWNIGNEEFFESARDTVNSLKVRASYGVAGNNNIGNYASIAALSGANASIDGTVTPGYKPGGFSNEELGWERAVTTDLGVDVSFLNNRINLSADYYLADTKDLLLNVPIPRTTGYSSAIQNMGVVRNSGFDIELKTVNISRGSFQWTTNFNLNYNKNEVKKLGPDGSPITGIFRAGIIGTKTEIGREIGSYWVFEEEGLFKDEAECQQYAYKSYANKNPRPGDIKYADKNNDGVINDDDRVFRSNRPKFTWGMTNNFSWKGIGLSVFVDGVSKCYLANLGMSSNTQSRGNVRGLFRDRWRSPENPGNGMVPRAVTTSNLTTPSTYWLVDASFWRIRNINLSYTLNQKLFKDNKYISGCSFFFNVDNVYSHDHCDHFPQNGTEVNTATVPGVNNDNGYPLSRTWTIGTKIKF